MSTSIQSYKSVAEVRSLDVSQTKASPVPLPLRRLTAICGWPEPRGVNSARLSNKFVAAGRVTRATRVSRGPRHEVAFVDLDRLPQPLCGRRPLLLPREFGIVIDSLPRAWGSHGASREIYVDIAKVYHARALKLACAKLDIQLLHRLPQDSSPNGIIEMAQDRFESEIRASHTVTLEKLNSYFQAGYTPNTNRSTVRPAKHRGSDSSNRPVSTGESICPKC